ncbi:hypothetical protein D3C78_1045040 [compost metagenome]
MLLQQLHEDIGAGRRRAVQRQGQRDLDRALRQQRPYRQLRGKLACHIGVDHAYARAFGREAADGR